jgi:hypothetical protein
MHLRNDTPYLLCYHTHAIFVPYRKRGHNITHCFEQMQAMNASELLCGDTRLGSFEPALLHSLHSH